MAAELVGGAFFSAFLQVLFDRLTSQEVVDLFGGKEPFVKLLNELNTTLFSAGLLLNDAEDKLIKDQKVKKWLDELKDTVYDADDLVYKINTEALRNKLEGKFQKSFTSKVLTKLVPTSFTAFDKTIKPEMDEIIEKLKVLLEPKNNPGLKIVENKKLPQRLPAPLVEESDVYGREVDKEAIIKFLLSDDASGDKLSVIPIVGMGGIGKTTLTQLVYNNERVNKRFNTKVWVTVGDDKVDCFKVMRIIIEKVTSEKCETEEPYDLQDKLKKSLIGKKCLFVLDDVWEEDPNKWDVLKSSFKSGLYGSKIIVTTRNKIVASIMETGSSIHYLDGVSYEDGWQLLVKNALIDVDSDEYLDLLVIGREIVNKCKGLPLAIKSLGGLLRHERNKKEWVDILNSDIWELYEKRRIGILPALWLSYYYLPSYLKPCFAYCALFPKDYTFEKEKIILLWMAEGFLNATNGKRIEEVGEDYFQDLISRSFFQPASRDQSTLLMHDLMHDVAIFVSSGFCFQENNARITNHARKFRHLSYNKGHEPRNFEALFKAKGLRTYLALPLSKFGERSYNKDDGLLSVEYLLKTLTSKERCLRVLSLSQCYITKLSDSIGDLKYLKYLDLSYTEIEEIPDPICNLYNLQTLLLEGCTRITQIPMNIGNLINLRHLHTPPCLKEMPLQIGQMKTLQTLSEFFVGKNNEFGIKLLKELQELHGTLFISGLENVAGVKDVVEAELKDKKFLSELILRWHSSYVPDDSQEEREILSALEPHANLKEISIFCYQGTTFPNWVGDHLFSNVITLSLHYCKHCCFLPPLGQLSSLKHLEIVGFDGLERIASEFYYSNANSPTRTKPFRSLEILHIKDMSKLQEWLFIEREVESGIFPCLKELYLSFCPRLKVLLPNYLPSLRKLDIYKCDKLVPLLPRAEEMDSAFPSLETIKISECDSQDLLLAGGLPSSLKELSVSSCECLTTLDEEAFHHLTSLEKLDIAHWNKLQCLPKRLPTSLSFLSIHNCRLLTPRLQKETGGLAHNCSHPEDNYRVKNI